MKIWFVGAGPGDPELITVKGMKLLKDADLVVYTGSLVPEAVLKWAGNCECINSASLDLQEIFLHMKNAFENGRRVVRLHTGDPSLYGAVFEQMTMLDKAGIPYGVIPGVTAAFAAAAGLKIEYTLPEITQTLIFTRISGRTQVPETEMLEDLAAHKASMAVYLSISRAEKVQKILQDAYGEDFICAVAYRVTQPEEKLIKVPLKKLSSTVKQEHIENHAMVIVSPALHIDTADNEQFSNLYNPHFKHSHRN